MLHEITKQVGRLNASKIKQQNAYLRYADSICINENRLILLGPKNVVRLYFQQSQYKTIIRSKNIQ